MSKRSAAKAKMKKAVKRVRAHNAVPRSLGAGGPPGAVKYLSTNIIQTDASVVGLPGVADSPAEGAAFTGILNIAQIPRGDGAQYRKYNKVSLKSVAIRGVIHLGAANDKTSVTGCLMLVYDRNRNQRSTLAMSEILSAAGTFGLCELSLSEPNGAPRFKVLRRWPYSLGVGDGSGAPSAIVLDAFVNLKNKPCSWINTDATGASTAAMDGPLYFIHVSSAFAVATPTKAPVFNGQARVYFADP